MTWHSGGHQPLTANETWHRLSQVNGRLFAWVSASADSSEAELPALGRLSTYLPSLTLTAGMLFGLHELRKPGCNCFQN